MADARWQRTWEIFHDALDRAPDTRAAYVADACGGDRDLAAEVNRLLAANESDHAFLADSAGWLAGVADDEPAAGATIGPYTVRRLIGEGGMGVVYEATQDGEISRTVALKLIRSGMASREILARFAIERQALALMNHPNIATAYDVGVSDGRPYFAMEYVDGQPLTKFCDAHALTLRDRLTLFLQVCDAVEHAHQKGVLHRDLKPSNILAGREGSRTVLKVIDFGVAKATAPRPGSSFVTQAGRFIGTPEYMSPEQAGVKLDVDTRADIYSLGVTLYELLAGVLPVDPERLRSASFGEIERLLFAGDLPRPSRRVAALPATVRDEAARRRQLGPAALVRQLQGDLDWIAGRAMEIDRDRRYPSVSELAADIRRHLASEPIVAAPPGAAYRAGKFVRRHRAAVAAAAAIVLLSAGFVVSLIRSNARTERALQEAGIERERSSQVSSFMTSLFRVAKPSTAAANAITARELLDQGAADIRARLGDQPAVQARLMETMGEVYTNLGLLDQAQALLLDALDVRRRTLGPDHREVADTLARLGRVHVSKGEHKDALARHREALAIYRRATTPDPNEISIAQLNIGRALLVLGELDEAERSLQEALATRTGGFEDEDETVAEILMRLGGVAVARNDLAGAERYRRQGSEMMLRLKGEGHIDVARARNDLAIVYYQKGDDESAEKLYRQALATNIAVLGEDHAEVATTKNNLGSVLRRQRKFDEAERLLRESLATRRRQSGEQHPEVAVTLNALAMLMRAKGDPAASVDMLREALAIMRKTYGETHPNVATTQANLGEMLHEAGDPGAEPILEQALAGRRKTLPAGHPNIALSSSALAHVRVERGDARAAEPMLREALAAIRKNWPDDNPRVAQAKAYLGGALVDLRQYDEAGPLLRDSLKILEKGGSAHDRQYVEKQLARFPR